MQKKNEEQTELTQTRARALRERLRQLVQQVDEFESHQTPSGRALTSSYAQALMVLLDFTQESKKPTLSDLVDRLDIDKSNVTRLCQRMEDSGHIELVRDPKDRRAKRISLSDDGTKLAQFVDDASIERYFNVIDNLDASENEELLGWLVKLSGLLDDVGE